MANKSITVTVPHHLTAAEARTRIQSGIADARNQFSGKIGAVEEHWEGNQMDFRFASMGQSVTGRIDVGDENVSIRVDLPWILAMLAERIRPALKTQAQKLLMSSGK